MPEYSGLLIDLYELTMAAGYFNARFEARATFEVFVRHLPPHRNYLIAAGLEQAIEFLEKVHFTKEDISYLRRHSAFREIHSGFFDYLAKFRFTGEVWAMPEGTAVFPGEPIMRLVAPIAEAQLMETQILAIIGYQTMIASKAARVVTAAQGRPVVEFGARRAHGGESSIFAARAAAIGGCSGTSNVLAGAKFGIETYGTQAHSWIMAHENEHSAFRTFLKAFPDDATLLLDTYNVRNALKTILEIGRKPAGVRLDSGDLVRDSRWVRRVLDRAGWNEVKIFASGDLDELKIAELLAKGAAIDAFGVGTALATPGDAPHVSLIYKLVEIERGGKILEAAKFSQSKVTYPGRKQVFRNTNASGKFRGDRIALESEGNDGEPLLAQAMQAGRRIAAQEPVSKLRDRCMETLKHLPPRCLQINRRFTYPVHYSKSLKAMLEKVRIRTQLSAVK